MASPPRVRSGWFPWWCFIGGWAMAGVIEWLTRGRYEMGFFITLAVLTLASVVIPIWWGRRRARGQAPAPVEDAQP